MDYARYCILLIKSYRRSAPEGQDRSIILRTFSLTLYENTSGPVVASLLAEIAFGLYVKIMQTVA